MNGITIIHGDVRDVLPTLPDESVQCVVTSPPYWGLRDYQTATWEGGDAECDHSHFLGGNGDASAKQVTSAGTQKYQYKGECKKCGATRIDSQLGLERTPEEYVAKMVAVFREVRRVMRSDATLWLNMGDSYNAHPGQRTVHDKAGTKQLSNRGSCEAASRSTLELKAKDLLGIPWRLAFALQADGWWLRQWMPWIKRNSMPESTEDRPTKSIEDIFLLTKSERYHYDNEAVKMPSVTGDERKPHKSQGAWQLDGRTEDKRHGGERRNGDNFATRERRQHDWFIESWQGLMSDDDGTSPLAFVVNPQPFAEAHFATFPPKLVKPMILAGCSDKCCAKCGAPWKRVTEPSDEYASILAERKESGRRRSDDAATLGLTRGTSNPSVSRETRTLGFSPTCSCNAGIMPGTVLDPFFGSGTTGLVARANGCKCIGIELSAEYIAIAEKRLSQEVFDFTGAQAVEVTAGEKR